METRAKNAGVGVVNPGGMLAVLISSPLLLGEGLGVRA
jgi:hypothetical protein